MQQVAASNKDLAAPGLFPGDPVTSDVTGSGGNFAKVLESQNSSSGDSNSGEQGYRGHGDFFDSPGEGKNRQVSLEEGAKKESKIGDGFSDSFVEPGDEKVTVAPGEKNISEGKSDSHEPVLPADGKAMDLENDPHEEWISIIQRIKDGEGFTRETVTPIIPEDGLGRGIAATPGENTDEVATDIDAELIEIAVQGASAQSNPENENLINQALTTETLNYESEVSSEDISGDDVVLAQTLSWKEELKQKLLNAGQSFNGQQIKGIEKELSGMTDTEIQQLLNSDPALKQMLSDVMKVQEQELDPQDMALLMALTGEGQDDLQDSSSDIDTMGISVDAESEVFLEAGENAAQADTQQDDSNESQEQLHEQVITESGVQNQVASQSEQALDIGENPAEDKQPVSEASKVANAPANAAIDAAVKDTPVKDAKAELDILLSELDNSLQSDKQKVATLENLTRRVESSELANTPAGKTFVETIKGATAEFKEQLKSGHEPGINIDKIVSEAVNAEAGKAEASALEGQVRGAVHKMVDVAQTHLSLEPATRENLVSSVQNSLSNRENNLAQIEASKTQQQNFQSQILDKAVNINKPEAAQELANKVQVMMNQKNMVADIRLDPPDLGQMQIKIALQGDSASVSMVVQSQAAREALEHNEPRLKELLEQQGIELGQSSVQQESKGNKGEGDGSNFASGKGGDAMDDLTGDSEHEKVVTVDEPDGIDYFA